MLSPYEKQQLFREMRRDAAERSRLQAGCARIGVYDAAESDEPLREFAIRMLKKLGMTVPADPVEALSRYLDGREAGGRDRARDTGGLLGQTSVRTPGMDGIDDGSLVGRYLRGE